ncbi:hypothetical protein GWI33_017885 [Rhynchophorus ferrugineus]|uniref:Uncharacterized protein n=1 Tax=Rhynchophorus ferrugineus TaxID=354439 RepID=A0A834HYV5_RHYFE|nr:hypothetical protein GWI33_017885 [Rhynchophorus ferrugineus]
MPAVRWTSVRLRSNFLDTRGPASLRTTLLITGACFASRTCPDIPNKSFSQLPGYYRNALPCPSFQLSADCWMSCQRNTATLIDKLCAVSLTGYL